MRNVVRGVAVALAGAAVLTGCFRVESSFDIDDDGTVDVAFEFAFDLEVLEEFGELFGCLLYTSDAADDTSEV